jgi:hypothetical protein
MTKYITIILASIITNILAYSSRSGLCFSDVSGMTSGMGVSTLSSNGSQWSIAVSRSGSVYSVTVSGGSSFKGLLLYGRMAGNSTSNIQEFPSVGSWSKLDDKYQTLGTQCAKYGSENSVLSHNSDVVKQAPTTFIWNPPMINSAIEFRGMVVVNGKTEWVSLPPVTVTVSKSSKNSITFPIFLVTLIAFIMNMHSDF